MENLKLGYQGGLERSSGTYQKTEVFFFLTVFFV